MTNTTISNSSPDRRTSPKRVSPETYRRRRAAAIASVILGVGTAFGVGHAIQSHEEAEGQQTAALVNKLSQPLHDVQSEMSDGEIRKSLVVMAPIPAGGISAPREAARLVPDSSYGGYQAAQEVTSILEAQQGGRVDLQPGIAILPASEATNVHP